MSWSPPHLSCSTTNTTVQHYFPKITERGRNIARKRLTDSQKTDEITSLVSF
jgi:hypothetical protein